MSSYIREAGSMESHRSEYNLRRLKLCSSYDILESGGQTYYKYKFSFIISAMRSSGYNKKEDKEIVLLYTLSGIDWDYFSI